MTFTSLASSSRGNCYIVSDGKTAILLECGLRFSQLKKRMGSQLREICACLVSHEHKDHSRCFMDLIQSGVEVFASEGTADALQCGLLSTIEAGKQFRAGSLTILPFETFHDAEEPLGFLIYSHLDGDRLVFATDTVNLGYQFPNVNLLALEANYDASLLSLCQRMPEKVKKRITNTHMEIETLCRYLRTIDLSRCREIYLLHLSNASSNERDFTNRVRLAVPDHVRVTACGE